jgi:hypothetical protein
MRRCIVERDLEHDQSVEHDQYALSPGTPGMPFDELSKSLWNTINTPFLLGLVYGCAFDSGKPLAVERLGSAR